MLAQNSEKTERRRGKGKPFAPGQSGNPGGRPKTARFAELVREFLDEREGNTTRLRHVLLSIQRDDPKILLYYAHGKPVEQLDVNTTSTVVGLPDDYLAILRAHAAKR